MRIRFSLRWALIVVAILGGVFAYGVRVYRIGQAQLAGREAGMAISGFVDLYFDYEVVLDGTRFPELAKGNPPLPATAAGSGRFCDCASLGRIATGWRRA